MLCKEGTLRKQKDKKCDYTFKIITSGSTTSLVYYDEVSDRESSIFILLLVVSKLGCSHGKVCIVIILFVPYFASKI